MCETEETHILGWTLMGTIQEQMGSSLKSVTNFMLDHSTTVNEGFKKLYDLEELGTNETSMKHSRTAFHEKVMAATR